MTKWEYEIIRPYGRLTDAEEDQMFARQGAAGYEFCGSAPHGGYIFTRPVEEPIASVDGVPIYKDPVISVETKRRR